MQKSYFHRKLKLREIQCQSIIKNKLWYIYIIEYHLAREDNETTSSQNNLEEYQKHNMSEGSQMWKGWYYMIPFIQSIKQGKIELCY